MRAAPLRSDRSDLDSVGLHATLSQAVCMLRERDAVEPEQVDLQRVSTFVRTTAEFNWESRYYSDYRLFAISERR